MLLAFLFQLVLVLGPHLFLCQVLNEMRLGIVSAKAKAMLTRCNVKSLDGTGELGMTSEAHIVRPGWDIPETWSCTICPLYEWMTGWYPMSFEPEHASFTDSREEKVGVLLTWLMIFQPESKRSP